MRPDDRNRFQVAMASLAEVFGKELSPQLVDLYWGAFGSAFIEQFERAAKTAISHMRFFPKPGDLRKFLEESAATRRPAREDDGPVTEKWLARVNVMFLAYLVKRRAKESFRRDLDLASRRAACRDLAEFFRELEADGDPEATDAELRLRFNRAMARIPDRLEAAA